MNIWQKVCIALGAVVIAFMLINPVVATKDVPDPSYNPNLQIFKGSPTMQVQYADYNATASRAVGAAVVTGALALLLGAAKQGNQ